MDTPLKLIFNLDLSPIHHDDSIVLSMSGIFR
jgi:hypothetical protein